MDEEGRDAGRFQGGAEKGEPGSSWERDPHAGAGQDHAGVEQAEGCPGQPRGPQGRSRAKRGKIQKATPKVNCTVQPISMAWMCQGSRAIARGWRGQAL